MPILKQGRLQIHYEIRGEGPPLLLLMGWQGNMHWWPERMLAQLEKKFQLILMDHRGVGHSKDRFGLYSIASLARDATVLLDALGLDAVHVLGVSMGGMVAQSLALHFPQRVDRLMLTSTSPRVGLLGSMNTQQKQRWLDYLKRPNRHPEKFLVELLFSSEPGHPKMFKGDGELQKMILASRTSFKTTLKQFLAIQGFDVRHRLTELKHKTLVVTGDNDLIIGAHHSHLLHRHLPNARLYEIKGGSHAMLDSAALELAEVYRAFLDSE